MTDLYTLAGKLVSACDAANITLATAESCTGGLIAGAITAVPGSSAVLDRGFVTYSNDAKIYLLGVEVDALEAHGAVSYEVAVQMALGAIKNSPAHLAVAVTGIAGPGGGGPNKPVGLVHMAVARRGEDEALVESEARLMLDGAFAENGRDGVREATVRAALQALLDAVSLGAAASDAP